jgi:alkanesulfonate monooxygenase SsuD/methylene tetrahydromethanopterin reductase-like flavin-dependent oxidoreductase (luciferase family)
MPLESGAVVAPDRRSLLKSTGALAGATGAGLITAQAQPSQHSKAAVGTWPKWQERWDRLIEAVIIIRQLWTGENVSFKGKYYTVEARLYDPPARPVPLLTAANGQQHKPEWEEGARAAGKNPADMPVLIEQFVVVGDEAAAKRDPAAGGYRNVHRRGNESLGDWHQPCCPHQEYARVVRQRRQHRQRALRTAGSGAGDRIPWHACAAGIQAAGVAAA